MRRLLKELDDLGGKSFSVYGSGKTAIATSHGLRPGPTSFLRHRNLLADTDAIRRRTYNYTRSVDCRESIDSGRLLRRWYFCTVSSITNGLFQFGSPTGCRACHAQITSRLEQDRAYCMS
jgi:hypothetical protein